MMSAFYNMVSSFYIEAHREMVRQREYSPQQLNVFVDIETEKLVLQYACNDTYGEHIAKETLPNMDDFKTFKQAFDKLKQEMKDEGQRIEFSDVIFRMECATVNDLVLYGYDKNTHFSISYIPIETDA